MAGVVESVRNLDDFRPHTHLVRKNGQPKPKFTWDSPQGEELFFAPGDIQTVYDVNNVKSSYTGTGQTITIVGQSQVSTADLDAFWSAAGVTRQDPTMFLVPGSGNQAVVADGDEAESDLDLEWSGAIANGASLDFVYTGNNSNYGAFDSIEYAIDQKIGTIISSSYGDCETDLGGQTLESSLEQATAQGQTVMSAAGDDGSTDCFEDTNLTAAQQEALAVDYPASSPNVTGVGGTEISQASATYETAPSAYWDAGTSTQPVVTTSALQYIPEQAWNEDTICLQYATTASQVLCAGGGGASALFTKPSWQAGVPGIPQDSKRDVPDLALAAAIYNPGYIFCTSDQSFWDTGDGQASSCTSGFFDSTNSFLTGGGGTSFATPIFAGMLALINQKQGYTTGQGLINPTLYTLASNSTTYASAFHDITSGSNACDSTGYCSSAGESGFSAGTGYDQATGLGSVDLFNLAAAWPMNTSSTAALIGTTTTVSASSTTPTINTSDTFTITVAPVTGSTVPSGTVTITVDTDTPVTGTLTANGTYTYTASFSTSGSHTVEVSYPSNAIYAGSTGSITVNVPVPVSGTGTFTLSATNITVAQGSVGSSTVTVTPAGGYTGTVQFSLTTTSTDLQNDTCPNLNNIGVSGTSPVTGTLTIDTNAANCQATGTARKRTGQVIHAAGLGSGKTGPMTAIGILAGLLLAGYLGRYSGKLRMLAGIILLATLGIAFTGCGGSSSTTIPNAPKGTYTLTLTGTDANTSTITATTTFTLTID
jgi:subtilase family serine protease